MVSASQDGITRKDFLNGLLWTAGAAIAGCPMAARAQDKGPDDSAREYFLERGISERDPRYYPPGLNGMRGSHPGAFETGHMLRDGLPPHAPGAVKDTGETYDLIVVGAGISGLAAAYFYRQKMGPQARILILENHDDIGGHAKRNEFEVNGRQLIGYGGTQAIEGIPYWSEVGHALLKDLGIDLKKFYTYFDQDHRRRWQLTDACFFDKETFGADRLVPDRVGGYLSIDTLTPEALRRFLDASPLSAQGRDDLMRINFGKADILAGLSQTDKLATLNRTNCLEFLERHAKISRDAIAYLNGMLFGIRAVGLEAIDAKLGLEICAPGLLKAMGIASAWEGGSSEPYIFHFPDGNASIARLLVRSLVPGSLPGSTMEDIVTARLNYAALDDSRQPVRIRLNSTVVRARNLGSDTAPSGVEAVYVRDGVAYRVRAAHAVLACWNMIIPYLCPEMPEPQREALSANVKVPLVYGTVAIRNWKAFQKLRAGTIYAPSMFWSEVYVDFPVSMGSYQHSRTPDEPVLLHLVHTPRSPGLPMKDQYRAGRFALFTTPFATFENNVRSELDRIFGSGGFDSKRDITAITINRWPHGYCYMASPLWDAELPEDQQPHVVGRQRFGRITIANADAGGIAETYVSIDQAHRAVTEIAAMVA